MSKSLSIWLLVLMAETRGNPVLPTQLQGIDDLQDDRTIRLIEDLSSENMKSTVTEDGTLTTSEFRVGSLADECQDLSSLCARYSKHCTHPNVKRFCIKTCNLCPALVKVGKCSDQHTSEYCEHVKQLGYCSLKQYRSFLLENCRKTCGLCVNETCGVAPLRRTNSGSVIVGGVSASKSYWPWQVALLYDDRFICGGTLIDAERILTAAHCFNYISKDAQRYSVVLGEHNREYSENTEQTVRVKVVRIHAGYNTGNDDHDIALLQLAAPAQLNDHVVPACLPQEMEELKVGAKCYATGWGSTRLAGPSATLLQEVELPIADPQLCAQRNAFNLRKVSERMICAGYSAGLSFKSACHGDSGGPLVCYSSASRWTLHGIVSWGSPRCDGFDRYSVFTRVSAYIDWIESGK